ncbi:Enamine/imine deaminase [compost metagenome]
MNIERRPFHLPVPLSAAVRAGDFLFMSGIVALDAQGKVIKGDIREQTRNVLEQIEMVLNEYGLKASDVVRTSIWLADLSDSAAFNEVYGQFFDGALPARSCVQAALYDAARVEIEVQALIV